MTTFCIITVGRNCARWLPNNITATASQDYPKDHVRVALVDDASTDETGTLMKAAAAEHGWDCQVNSRRLYGVGNQYTAIHRIARQASDVIIFVDADDWLNGPDVLRKLDAVYSDPDVLLTYGRFISYPPENMHRQPRVRPFPPHIIGMRQTRQFERQNGSYWNHLRTFRYGPFTEIKPTDIQYPGGPKTGQFFHAGTDTSLMVPMLELVGCRFRMLDEPLLVYNTQQNEPDWCTHKPQIVEAEQIIFSAPVKPLWRPTDLLLAQMQQLARQVPVPGPKTQRSAPPQPRSKLRRPPLPKPRPGPVPSVINPRGRPRRPFQG